MQDIRKGSNSHRTTEDSYRRGSGTRLCDPSISIRRRRALVGIGTREIDRLNVLSILGSAKDR